ncbi:MULTISPECIES: DUF305 domain-containing protein [Nostocales]|jgi:uncharacterized protein (DUF305 family)|uniref:DUF305 domain-containing protein n=1 Tax=Nostocales TaxID=1161 RepID=UPI0002E7C455|nr:MULTISPECIES: DUF305 domain-containing protein [Nostocales]MBD2435171.1 DUF305 domain-containing protein [Fischerella sp. FACHB-380]MDM9383639.1 DUF305 domain-containing protein [Chlorogloeopsis sp. ULAP01]
MKNRILIYSLTGLLTSSVLAGLLITNKTQAQSPNSEHNTHHPSAQATPSQRGMMTQVDRHFIEMMVPHHEETVKMADLALTRTKRPEIKKLAETIKKDRSREIQQMRTWYKAWYGTEVPANAMAGMGMMRMQQGMGQDNQGMMRMSGKQNMMGMEMHLEDLKNTSDFDREFIRQMIHHNQMGVMMSQMALNSATKPEIRNLAQSIIKTQTAEIAQMQQWYQAWYQPTPTQSQQ